MEFYSADNLITGHRCLSQDYIWI